MRKDLAHASPPLAHVLKDVCLEGWSSNPARALAAARTLQLLAEINAADEILALRDWAVGLSELIHGRMESAIAHLDNAKARFEKLIMPDLGASTQVSKLIALAMLGRYDDAIACGLSARSVFTTFGDSLAIGKVEHNLGNIYFRRDQYQDAESFQRSALEHFLTANDQTQIAKIENSLALTLSQQHQVEAAERLYADALARAEEVGLVTTQAEIESSIGTLALYQGYYDRALDFLERSRRKYSKLDRPHILALTEQEIADTYLELNLGREASTIYARVATKFSDLGMRAEEAHALAYHGRALILLGEFDKAHSLLEEARNLYLSEANDVGAALVELTVAQLRYAQKHFLEAQAAAESAAVVLERAGNPRRTIFARWLQGEAARASGTINEAQVLLSDVLTLATRAKQFDLVVRTLTSLGLLAQEAGDLSQSETFFREATELVEQLRAPLPAEEFRTSFLADKLVAYHELVKLCVESGGDRVDEAFQFLERARSRALVDNLSGTLLPSIEPRDVYEQQLSRQLEELRHQLSYYYSQLNLAVGPGTARSPEVLASLQEEVHTREGQVAELLRQLQHHDTKPGSVVEQINFSVLQESLGSGRALVEFTVIGDEMIAFVLTNEGLKVVRKLGSETEIAADVGRFRFQIESLRFGSNAMRRHLPALTQRALTHSQHIYQKLLRPLAPLFESRDLVFVPHGSLHYLPFHALHDGKNYLVESRSVSYAPSALVLQHCLKRDCGSIESALLVGVPDERTPRITDEIQCLQQVFAQNVTLTGEAATLKSVMEAASRCSVLHLACHAQFRTENPQFSSLQLADSWLTVRDTYKLKLNCELVTLSACETGVNAVAPGEELIGLARGFLSAGTPSILLSLWTVDDEATAQLMEKFYVAFKKTNSASAALRAAQMQMLAEKSHPFFWSPFVLVGRW